MTQTPFLDEARESILQTDIGLLNANGVGDDIMSGLAAEHAARVETLCKAINPTMGRSLLLMVAGGLMAAAQQITDFTVQQPELVNV
jgi:hypothetical protein